MAKSKADPDPDITVRLANPHRTSAGDCPPDRTVTLPPDEARSLIQQGLAVRVLPPVSEAEGVVS